jgi:putative endonuclease
VAQKMKSFLYILKSEKSGFFYVGSTTNLNTRLKFHNYGLGKATRYRRPYKLVFYQEFDNIKLAQKAEAKIKSWKRKNFIEKIIKDGFIKFVGP